MARIDDYLDLVADPDADALVSGDAADDALVALLAHVAFADGDVDDRELDFLERVFPGRERGALREWAIEAGAAELDLAAVADALPSPDERWTGLRFAAHMAWKDGVLTDEEMAFLASLARYLALPEGALDQVIAETVSRTTRPTDPRRVREALAAVKWRAVQSDELALTGDLVDIVPPGAQGIGRVGVEQVEMLGFYDRGLVGRFREGHGFLPWDDIVAYNRVPTMRASVVLRTESGRAWTLVDHRLTGLTTFFDRLFAEDAVDTPAAPPVIRQLRGE